MEHKLSPEEYENVVATLVETLDSIFSGKVRKGRTNLVRGASGFEHQIDVSIDTPKGLVLMECKRLKRHVGVSHALTLAARRLDIQQANPKRPVFASMVSMQEVQVGALKVADHFDVSIDQVLTLDSYAVTIIDRHYAGLAENVGFSDSAEATVSSARTRSSQRHED